jgi:hypothetical protein
MEKKSKYLHGERRFTGSGIGNNDPTPPPKSIEIQQPLAATYGVNYW